jgi:hypothetical protein
LEPTNQIVWSSFLLRLWRETPDGEWRGEITHLQSQESRYFAAVAHFQEFIVKYAPGFDVQTINASSNSNSFDEAAQD